MEKTIRSILSGMLILLAFVVVLQCRSKTESTNTDEMVTSRQLNISLAQWSIHHAIEDGRLRAEDFASIARNDFGINAIEYVASFYKDYSTDRKFWERMKATADSLGVKSLLIMVDNEGDLGSPDEMERSKAVENHFKWVEAASILGCHSIRVNAFGEGSKLEVQEAMVAALKQLCSYAGKYNISVLIENHGLYSSDGKWVAEIMQRVSMPNCGTLPDFGNWCTAVKWGSTQNNQCAESYDIYKGTEEMLPFAHGVSAKSYAFDANGEETTIDFTKMLNLVHQSDFDGYIGIEYEGSKLSEQDGIKATKALLEKSWTKINQQAGD